jgi:hypothetical protein
MCRISFRVVDNHWFRLFVKALCPAYAKHHLPCANTLSSTHLEHAYAEAVELTESKLNGVPGKKTLSLDGHKNGKHRSVVTTSILKLGLSTFFSVIYMLTRQADAEGFAEICRDIMGAEGDGFIAVVADNTGPNRAMLRLLQADYRYMFFLGCFVHVLDLLIEDISKIPAFTTCASDVHFLIAFIKRHSLIWEAYLILKKQFGVSELTLFPATRFAYMYLMVSSVCLNWRVLNALLDDATYLAVKARAIARRGKDGDKAARDFEQYVAFDHPIHMLSHCIHGLLQFCFEEAITTNHPPPIPTISSHSPTILP